MAIRVGVADDPEKFLDTDLVVWSDGRGPDPTDVVLRGLTPDQRFAATDDEAPAAPLYAGVYGVFPLTLSIPGPRHTVRQVPVGGLTWVGVHPDQRRKGVLTSMIRDHFARVADTDWTGISALHASEPVIYGRFGYGLASRECKVTLGRGTTLVAPGLDEEAGRVRTELVDAAAEGVAGRVRAATLAGAAVGHGVVTLPEDLYAAYAHEHPDRLHNKEPQRVLLASLDGEDVGSAWFRREPKWENGQPQGTVKVMHVVGTPTARLALARRLVELDLMAKIEISGCSRDDLLQRWVGPTRGVVDGALDSLWLRLVDLPTAMAARGYSGAADLVLEVTDDFLPDQGGRWRLVADEAGSGRVERVDAVPDVTLTTQQLAGAYLGDGSLLRLLQAGTLQEHRQGAVARLDAALAMPFAPDAATGF